MKVLAKFIGKVIKIEDTPDYAHVTLTDTSINVTTETSVESINLIKAGIDHDGCDFEIIIADDNGRVFPVLKKLQPRHPESEPEPPSDFCI